jgi:hypothetical protein
MLIPADERGAQLFVAPLPIALLSAMIRRTNIAYPQAEERDEYGKDQSQDDAQTAANSQQMAAPSETDPQEVENLMRSV